jgi:flagellar biosynthesis/type III secretory pathway protein FliH
LTEQWVQAYKKVPEKSVEKIKQEVNMSFTATTITEHYFNEGKIEGEIKGKIEGKIEGIEELYRFGILSKEQMEQMIEPLKQQLQNLQSSEKKHIH